MGTTGSGRFGNYQPNQNRDCPAEIVFNVEDIDISEYFQKSSSLPSVGSEVFIKNMLVNKRMVVVDKNTELILGNVPTVYNYIFDRCIMAGKEYNGEVRNISTTPFNKILVELKLK